jgi:hypothetical protein
VVWFSSRGLFVCVRYPCAFARFPDFLNIGKIAHPARRKPRRNRVILGNEEGLETACRVYNTFNAPSPCSVEINPVNAGRISMATGSRPKRMN